MMTADELLRTHSVPERKKPKKKQPTNHKVHTSEPSPLPHHARYNVCGKEYTLGQISYLTGIDTRTALCRLSTDPDSALRPKGRHRVSKAKRGGITDIMRVTGIGNTAACKRKRRWPREFWYAPKGSKLKTLIKIRLEKADEMPA